MQYYAQGNYVKMSEKIQKKVSKRIMIQNLTKIRTKKENCTIVVVVVVVVVAAAAQVVK
jgi:hypothetical protein